MELSWKVTSALCHCGTWQREGVWKWIGTDPWLTSLVLVSQSICVLILVICDAVGSYLVAACYFKTVPEINVGC